MRKKDLERRVVGEAAGRSGTGGFVTDLILIKNIF
jgi:hypothetical protein